MINLLPSEKKQGYLFARRNTIALRFIVGLSIGLVGIAVVVAGGLWFIGQQTDDYSEAIASSKATLAKQNEASTISRVQGISDSLTLVVKVLNQEVLFSELLRQVGAAMPSGTVLRNLSLSSNLTGALDLEAQATDFKTASQVQLNLKDPKNRIFTSADIVSIKCGGTDPTYPCTVILRAQFSADNAFMLLSNQRGQQ